MTNFNGETIAYDEIGNPIQYKRDTLTWTEGRRLSSISHPAPGLPDYRTVHDYKYNAAGQRISKTTTSPSGESVTTEFIYNGDQLVGQKTSDGSEDLEFLYDDTGSYIGFVYRNAEYYYMKNLQGDIIGIVDSAGLILAIYAYTPWGQLLTIDRVTGSSYSDGDSSIGSINPIRYRGYYYDNETRLYYLNSRYYDPEVGRFISSDSVMGVNADMATYNLYAYCGNNPIIRCDVSGTHWDNIIDAALHIGNMLLLAVGIDTAAGGAFFLNMSQDENGIYHASFNCWQQYAGYMYLYDVAFDIGTDMSAGKFDFTYAGQGYTIWVWKGDYINLGAGAELGIYRGSSGIRTVDKSLAMQMGMTLHYRGNLIIDHYPEEYQWWITGFNAEYLNKHASDLTATFEVIFSNHEMYRAFRAAYPNNSMVEYWDSRSLVIFQF